MKKVNLIALIAGASFLPLSGLQAATDSAKISVSGSIVDNTCTLDTATSDLNPVLDTISDRDMQTAGTVKGEKSIKIVLKNCGKDTTGVQVKAAGTADSDNDSAFKNSGTAQGIGLYFYKTDGETIFKPGDSENSTFTPDVDGGKTLTYKAAYVSTTDNPSAGDFKSEVDLTFTYL